MIKNVKTILLASVELYLHSLPKGHGEKIGDMIRLLEAQNGVLDEPYSRHLRSKIRELRIPFGGIHHRVLYTLLPDQIILHLVAFSKKTPKTPTEVIDKAIVLRKMWLDRT